VCDVGLKDQPRKTWGETVEEDMSELGSNREDTQDRVKWKKVICGEKNG